MSKAIPIVKWAIYKGIKVLVDTEKDGFFYVHILDQTPPKDLLMEMYRTGIAEYFGKIRSDDPELKYLESTEQGS